VQHLAGHAFLPAALAGHAQEPRWERGEGLAKRLLASRELFVAVAAPVSGRDSPARWASVRSISTSRTAALVPDSGPMPPSVTSLAFNQRNLRRLSCSLSPVNLTNSAISSACRSWRLDHPGKERLHTRVGLGIVRLLRCPFLRAPQPRLLPLGRGDDRRLARTVRTRLAVIVGWRRAIFGGGGGAASALFRLRATTAGTGSATDFLFPGGRFGRCT
jgi:hypothetical protein